MYVYIGQKKEASEEASLNVTLNGDFFPSQGITSSS